MAVVIILAFCALARYIDVQKVSLVSCTYHVCRVDMLKWRAAVAALPAVASTLAACSVTLSRYVSSAQDLHQQAAVLLAGLRVPVEEIRGLGITVRVQSSQQG